MATSRAPLSCFLELDAGARERHFGSLDRAGQRAGGVDNAPSDGAEIVIELLLNDAAIGVGGVSAARVNSVHQRLRRGVEPKSDERPAGLTRDCLDRDAFLRLGEDGVDDDRMPGSESSARLVLQN